MAKFEPVLLARIHKENSQSLAGYQADGGYAAFDKALGMAPIERCDKTFCPRL